MILYPAIDLKGGHCVRLFQGRLDQETRYGADPVAVAWQWQTAGARWIHVVDLDGAVQGHPVHQDQILEIRRHVTVQLQVGGGIRTPEHLKQYLEAGVDRVVLGSVVVERPPWLEAMARAYPGRVAVSLDARGEQLAVAGWTRESGTRIQDLLEWLGALPLACVIYTSILKDGTLAGPDVAGIARICRQSPHPVIASGGIGSWTHLEALRSLEPEGLQGVILGRALYEGTLDLAEAIQVFQEPGGTG